MSQRISLEDANELNYVLRTVTGSEVYNAANGDSSDRDEIGVYIPTRRELFAVSHPYDVYIYRSAHGRENEIVPGKELRSFKGDLDLIAYEIRKFAGMLFTGHMSVLTPLMVEDKWVISMSERGQELRDNLDKLVSRHTATKTLGYMDSQFRKMVGAEVGPKRPELVEQHGYDTKFAAHMIRLGVHGTSIMTGSGAQIPLNEENSAYVQSIRRGDVERDAVIARYHELRSVLSELLDTNPYNIRESSDEAWINDWLYRTMSEAS